MELPGAPAHYRSPCVLYTSYSQDGHQAKGPLKLPWRKAGNEKESLFLAIVKRCRSKLKDLGGPTFPSALYIFMGLGDGAQEDPNTLGQRHTSV